MDVFCLFVPGVLYISNLIARKLYCLQFLLCKLPKGRSLFLLLRRDKRDRSNKPYELLRLTVDLVGCDS